MIPPWGSMKKSSIRRVMIYGGAYWTRTSDPIDVNDVLYQLSQSTMGVRYLFRACFHNANRKALCTSASMFYQLSQSTVVCATLSATHIIIAQVVGDVKGESGENWQKFSC